MRGGFGKKNLTKVALREVPCMAGMKAEETEPGFLLQAGRGLVQQGPLLLPAPSPPGTNARPMPAPPVEAFLVVAQLPKAFFHADRGVTSISQVSTRSYLVSGNLLVEL